MSKKSTSPTSTTRKPPLKMHFLHTPDALRVSNVRIFRVSSHKSQFKVACVSKREDSRAHENISLLLQESAHKRVQRKIGPSSKAAVLGSLPRSLLCYKHHWEL
jgi:hypothetical protein